MDAVNKLTKEGFDVEVIDLRTISPYDWDMISSVKKTGKALVVYEDNLSWGSGSEIAARIGDELFDYRWPGRCFQIPSLDIIQTSRTRSFHKSRCRGCDS